MKYIFEFLKTFALLAMVLILVLWFKEPKECIITPSSRESSTDYTITLSGDSSNTKIIFTDTVKAFYISPTMSGTATQSEYSIRIKSKHNCIVYGFDIDKWDDFQIRKWGADTFKTEFEYIEYCERHGRDYWTPPARIGECKFVDVRIQRGDSTIIMTFAELKKIIFPEYKLID